MKQQSKSLGIGGIVQWVALIILVASMFSASKKAAIPAIMAIVKFAWPFLVIWFVWRFIKGKVTGAMGRFQDQILQAAQQPGVSGSGPFGSKIRDAARRASQENVIDLCPKCGVLLNANHVCKSHS